MIRSPFLSRLHLSTAALALILCTAGCSGIESEAKYPSGNERTTTGDDIYGERQSVFGHDGLNLFGGSKKKSSAEGGNGIGVNSFLWRASLDTVSFMPLASADPFGGVIITDWYSTPQNTDERFKLNVLILGRALRSDGIRVTAFKQRRVNGNWEDDSVAEGMERQLEDAILTRARQLRIANIDN